MSQTIVKLYYYYIADGPTLLNPSIYSVQNLLGNSISTSQTDVSGIANFDAAINGPNGVLWFYAKAIVSLVNANSGTSFDLQSILDTPLQSDDYLAGGQD